MKFLLSTALLSVFCASLVYSQDVRPGISIVPPLAKGETPDESFGHHVFYDLAAGEYVITYTDPAEKDPTAAQKTFRLGAHSLTDPDVSAQFTIGENQQYRYNYTVANKARAPADWKDHALPAGHGENGATASPKLDRRPPGRRFNKRRCCRFAENAVFASELDTPESTSHRCRFPG